MMTETLKIKIVIADALIDTVVKDTKIQVSKLKNFKGKDFKGTICNHPF